MLLHELLSTVIFVVALVMIFTIQIFMWFFGFTELAYLWKSDRPEALLYISCRSWGEWNFSMMFLSYNKKEKTYQVLIEKNMYILC